MLLLVSAGATSCTLSQSNPMGGIATALWMGADGRRMAGSSQHINRSTVNYNGGSVVLDDMSSVRIM